MRTASRIVACFSILTSVAACDEGSADGSPQGTGGAGGDARETTGTGGAASRTAPVDFPAAFTASVVTTADGAAPDLSCVGSAKVPSGGEPIDVALRFVDTIDPRTRFAGRRVSIFPRDGVYPGSCPDFYCFRAKTDADGLAEVTVPRGAWYGFEVEGDEEVVRSFQIHTPAPARGDEPVDSMVTTRAGLRALATRARLPHEAGLPFLAGRVHDCRGAMLANVLVSVVSPDGERLQPRAADPEEGAPGTVYFVDGEGGADDAPMPDPLRAVGTGSNGRFAVGGIAPQPGLPYRIEAWAVTAPGAEPERIACEAAVALDDSIAIVGMHPTRDDYELDHPCRFP